MHEVRMSVKENVLSNPALVTKAHYEALLQTPGASWVWTEGGAIRGFVIMDFAERNLWALFVHPDHEGLGIGRSLLTRILKQCRMLGLNSLTLSTDPATRAFRFYLTAGWERKDPLPSGEVLMEYCISPLEK